MSLATRMRATAKRLLDKNGEQITYSKVTTGAYDPATGTVTNTASNITLYCFTATSNSDYIITQNRTGIEAGQNLATQVILYLPAIDLGVIPEPNDQVTLRGEVWQVIAVDFTAAQGLDVIYKVVVQK